MSPRCRSTWFTATLLPFFLAFSYCNTLISVYIYVNYGIRGNELLFNQLAAMFEY
ncbi:MAG: hypothetical protein ACI957_004303 [Verrucomicrobiales bacterium]|jgi:hypothetical protein